MEALAGRHRRIKPYTPRHNGKVERYNRLLADEGLYIRPYPSEQARREAIGTRSTTSITLGPISPAAISPQPHASRPVSGTSCPLKASYR